MEGTDGIIRKNGWIARKATRAQKNSRDFDLMFWQEQSAEARFDAVWEMVVLAHELKGGKESELRLDRSAISVQRRKH